MRLKLLVLSFSERFTWCGFRLPPGVLGIVNKRRRRWNAWPIEACGGSFSSLFWRHAAPKLGCYSMFGVRWTQCKVSKPTHSAVSVVDQVAEFVDELRRMRQFPLNRLLQNMIFAFTVVVLRPGPALTFSHIKLIRRPSKKFMNAAGPSINTPLRSLSTAASKLTSSSHTIKPSTPNKPLNIRFRIPLDVAYSSSSLRPTFSFGCR